MHCTCNKGPPAPWSCSSVNDGKSSNFANLDGDFSWHTAEVHTAQQIIKGDIKMIEMLELGTVFQRAVVEFAHL